jgi:competence protein ComEC
MKATEGKRLVTILCAYIGIFSLCVLIPQTHSYIVWLCLAIAALFSARLFFREKRQSFLWKKAILSVLMAIAVISACVRGADFYEKTELASSRYTDGEVHIASGYVTKIVYEENYGSFYQLQLLSLDGKETKLRSMLSIPYRGEYTVGDTLSFEGVFSPPEEDYVNYRKADGIFLSAEAESTLRTGNHEMKTADFFEGIRLWMKTNFERYIEKEEAGFATAIMTGNRESLSARIRLAFTRIGISHVLAVSGLHLAIVIGGLDFLFCGLAVPRKAKNVILILFSCLFACVCGLSASIVRAAIMLSLYYFSDTIGERNDSLTSLFVAIFLIVLFRPSAVYDIGMWMSFLATFGILLTAPLLPRVVGKKSHRFLRKSAVFVLSLVCVTVSATFFTLPVTALAFGGISAISPLANLLFVPLIQIVLYLLVGLTAFGAIPVLASPIGRAAQTLISFAIETAEKLSDIKGVYVSLRYPFVPWVIAVLVVGILAVIVIRSLRARCIFAVFAFCLCFYISGYFGYARLHRDSAYVYLQTDGKSDAVGIVSQNKAVIVDISTGGYAVLCESVERAEELGACEIDTLVLTHYHPYHVSSIRKLTERVKLRRVLLPEPTTEKETEYYLKLRERLEGLVEIDVYPTDEAQSLQVGNAVLTLTETEYLKRSTHPIVRFTVSVGETGVSYLGESAAELGLSGYEDSVVIFGSNGPNIKNRVDAAPLMNSETIVFADRSHAALTDTDILRGDIVFPANSDGVFKILLK